MFPTFAKKIENTSSAIVDSLSPFLPSELIIMVASHINLKVYNGVNKILYINNQPEKSTVGIMIKRKENIEWHLQQLKISDELEIKGGKRNVRLSLEMRQYSFASLREIFEDLYHEDFAELNKRFNEAAKRLLRAKAADSIVFGFNICLQNNIFLTVCRCLYGLPTGWFIYPFQDGMLVHFRSNMVSKKYLNYKMYNEMFSSLEEFSETFGRFINNYNNYKTVLSVYGSDEKLKRYVCSSKLFKKFILFTITKKLNVRQITCAEQKVNRVM
ncbi:hypothetical protein AsGV006 [Agrotis segetum granulovirus]|uniref:Uncharacterized protein n=1 Tax=Agrotis segetum granulosis virus TaxID=10464 RepID=A0A023MIH9_GVAS|nr:hypothetical protein AsGV006 [Agrotis segetum granulovirus]AHN92044.1 hypothetical protein AsGV005 [Agrotis segetum granulovirus]AKN63280.1 hypothetical protein AsGV006 [Agrotis segetum granulovirus]